MNDMATNSSDLYKSGVYLFMCDVENETCKDAIEFILRQNTEPKKKKYLQMLICSNGGDIPSCFALIDIMRSSKIPIHTVGLGVIASCGLLIFITGEKGHRVLTPNTSILSHQYSWGNWGKEHELFAQIKEFEYKRRLQSIGDNRLLMFNYYNLELRYGYDKSTRMQFTPADRPTEFAFRPHQWYTEHFPELIQGYFGAFNSTRVLRNLEEHWNDQTGIQNLKRVGRSVLKDPATGARSAGNLFLAGAKFMENLYFVIEILQTWTDTFQFDEKAKKVKPQKPNYNSYT